MGKEKKHINQKLVNDFAATRSLASELSGWMESARDSILQQLRGGFVCPTSGPYLVVIEKSKQKIIDWKELLQKALTAEFIVQGASPDEAFVRAVSKVNEYESGAKKKTSVRLAVKTNPAFEHKFAAKAISQLKDIKGKRAA